MCLSFLLLLLLLLLSTPLPRHSDSWNPLSLSKSGVLSALDQQSAPAVGRPSPLSLVRSLVWRHSTPWAGRCLRIETRKASALSDIYLGTGAGDVSVARLPDNPQNLPERCLMMTDSTALEHVCARSGS
ncbi:hypothetical protein TgHK011_007594 [Trichoderma gracile]|nr:hypothetical protein TgHK011_007594 [Trichoderma gracile]